MKKIVFILLAMFLGSEAVAQSKMRINHLAIFVKDMKQSREFYTRVLGLDTIPEPFHDGKHAWLDLGFGTSLHIIQGANKSKEYFQNNQWRERKNHYPSGWCKASMDSRPGWILDRSK
jgi:lactoylglutathione lyase